MLKNLKRTDQKGFTIIEVMIVLAIAGLILLIVLLAIPALQRNSRNTQIKNDASAVVGAISTFASDNDGAVPTSITVSNGDVTLKKGSITGTAKIQSGTTFNTALTSTDSAPSTVDSGTLTLLFGKTCDPGGVVSTRAISVYYSVETTSAATVKCINS